MCSNIHNKPKWCSIHDKWSIISASPNIAIASSSNFLRLTTQASVLWTSYNERHDITNNV